MSVLILINYYVLQVFFFRLSVVRNVLVLQCFFSCIYLYNVWVVEVDVESCDFIKLVI